jgi:putative ABC transport system substrate-binding protein
MSARSADDRQGLATAFRRGLNESGFVEGKNVAIEYRWANFDFERLPAIARDFVQRKVDVIAAISGTPTVLAAKAATTTIPIVFAIGSDPIALGIVTSLNRPEGNITGASMFGAVLGAKRLELVRMLLPKAKSIAILVNPNNPVSTANAASVQTAAAAIGRIQIFDVDAADRLDAAFREIGEQRFDALLVTGDVFFLGGRDRIVALAAHFAIPAIYFVRDFVAAGGLMSYGTIKTDAVRQAAIYVARVLRGAKPADLPVLQPTKFELVINLGTAKALGLNVPPTLLSIADAVIE